MPEPAQRLSAALADRYSLERELGQGGMATVYLAEDLKHNRKVAIKVLKPELAAVLGAERFVQEIATTAALQHPNILPLFDSGEADGFLYYVMPFVEGETLRAKLDRESQLGVDESVKLVSEVADALQYAHEHGVVHRDIKPENILLHAGRPMVADFGIALAVSAAAGGRMTETGLSLGTPHYMSPEQATAEKHITARSDIYSLASVLYEMLTGNPPHVGSSAQQIIMRIVTDQVRPVTEIRKSVPPNVAAALAQALEKLPADRFASAKAFAEALTDLSFTATSATSATPAALHRSRRTTYLLSAACLVLAAAALWGWLRPRPVPPVRWDAVELGLTHVPAALPLGTAIAPDGSAIVYVDSLGPDDLGLTIKERDRPAPRLLVDLGNPRAAPGPAFSPDGRWIVYTDGKLEKVARAGGAPVALSDSAAGGGAAWLDDGTIAFIGEGGRTLLRTSANGGSTARVMKADSGFMLQIQPVPGANAVLIGVAGGPPHEIAVDLRDGTVHQLAHGAVGAWIVPGDIIVYGQANGSLVAAPFDRHALTIHGAPVPILDGVAMLDPAGIVDAVFGADGTLLYAEQEPSPTRGMQLVSVTRRGAVTALDSAWQPLVNGKGGIDLSPDGSRLALSISDTVGGRSDIYTLRLPDGPPVRLTFHGTKNIRPRWSPDGTTIMYVSNAGGKNALWTRRADGTGRPVEVVSDSLPVWEGSWSPDGKWIVYRPDHQTTSDAGDILAVRTTGDHTPDTLVATAAEEYAPTISPDGRWMAYLARRDASPQLYVRPFPDVDAGGPWQVSDDGARGPARWSHDGTAIFYRNGDDQMVEAQVTLKPTFAPGRHTVLFDTRPYIGDGFAHDFALSPDDDRFLMVRSWRGPPADARLILVENWMPELREKLRGGDGS